MADTRILFLYFSTNHRFCHGDHQILNIHRHISIACPNPVDFFFSLADPSPTMAVRVVNNGTAVTYSNNTEISVGVATFKSDARLAALL